MLLLLLFLLLFPTFLNTTNRGATCHRRVLLLLLIIIITIIPYILKHYSPRRHRSTLFGLFAAFAVAAVAAAAVVLGQLCVPFLCAEIKHKYFFNIAITNILKTKRYVAALK